MPLSHSLVVSSLYKSSKNLIESARKRGMFFLPSLKEMKNKEIAEEKYIELKGNKETENRGRKKKRTIVQLKKKLLEDMLFFDILMLYTYVVYSSVRIFRSSLTIAFKTCTSMLLTFFALLYMLFICGLPQRSGLQWPSPLHFPITIHTHTHISQYVLYNFYFIGAHSFIMHCAFVSCTVVGCLFP